jgi:hypothetical protein
MQHACVVRRTERRASRHGAQSVSAVSCTTIQC